MLRRLRCGVRGAYTRAFSVPHPLPEGTDTNDGTGGASYGIYETRTVFLHPIPRNERLVGTAAEMFGPETAPEKCCSPSIMTHLHRRFGVTEREAATAMIDARHNMNDAIRLLDKRGLIIGGVPDGSYGLVAVEAYAPVTFCAVSFAVPRYEMLADPDLHELLHELVLSASEMPTDSSSEELTRRFATEWTIEGGEKCSDVMARVEHGGLEVKAISMLPYGDYSVHGMNVLHPVSTTDYPNIGVAATSVAIDLKTGIHERFKFTVEKIADSFAEHVNREHVAIGQLDHVLKQPFWWTPSHSVEDYLRYKESLLMPSALMHELRYACVSHHVDGGDLSVRDRKQVVRPNPYRNLLELEALKTMQHKLGKHFKENGTPANVFTQSGMPIVLASVGTEGSGFNGNETNERFSDLANAERKVTTAAGMTTASERVWKRFYVDSLY